MHCHVVEQSETQRIYCFFGCCSQDSVETHPFAMKISKSENFQVEDSPWSFKLKSVEPSKDAILVHGLFEKIGPFITGRFLLVTEFKTENNWNFIDTLPSILQTLKFLP